MQAKDGFIAWPGAAADGRRFMAAALAQGAAACLMEPLASPEEAQAALVGLPAGAPVACLPGLKAQAGLVAAAFYATSRSPRYRFPSESWKKSWTSKFSSAAREKSPSPRWAKKSWQRDWKSVV